VSQKGLIYHGAGRSFSLMGEMLPPAGTSRFAQHDESDFWDSPSHLSGSQGKRKEKPFLVEQHARRSIMTHWIIFNALSGLTRLL
jgi:hypothetical protein